MKLLIILMIIIFLLSMFTFLSIRILIKFWYIILPIFLIYYLLDDSKKAKKKTDYEGYPRNSDKEIESDYKVTKKDKLD